MKLIYKPMKPKEFLATLDALDLSLPETARLLSKNLRTTQRYAWGRSPIPGLAAIVLRALRRQEMTLAQVAELAADKPPH